MKGSIGIPTTARPSCHLNMSKRYEKFLRKQEKREKFWQNLDWGGIKARIETKRRT